ncbi:HPF/RaiA family ribosome-associated protein [Tychonema sp. LEGE 07199]|nr:HPF/RaiA family ribosome-associated protein [Tychonema sp. LEGE 07199]MBE9133598.1 HPF/RaiA family ribosome-associated protein [Tychonema sp. LEGE 07196]
MDKTSVLALDIGQSTIKTNPLSPELLHKIDACRITHVDVHLSDENSDKKGGDDDMRCTIEARLKGHQPLAVTHQAATLDQAVDGAADKLTRLIDSTLGRLHDQENQRTDPPLSS